jgi:hypothetical protein
MKAELIKGDQTHVIMITIDGERYKMPLDGLKTESEAQKRVDTMNTCFECDRVLRQLIGDEAIENMVKGFIITSDIREALLINEHQNSSHEPDHGISHCKNWDNGKCKNNECGGKFCEFDKNGFLPEEERNCYFFNN